MHNIDNIVLFYVVPTTHVVSRVAILLFFPLRVIEIQKY